VRRVVALVIVAAACGGGRRPGPGSDTGYPTSFTPAPALGPPPPSDPTVRGHAYLEAVYDGIGGPWTQFLEDCRLRLAPAHPLNDPALVATAELAIDATGRLLEATVAGSGHADFDAAVTGVVRDRAPYPRPPPALVSDDGRLHLTWRFARDVRQAGVAGAEIVVIEWGVERAVPTLLGAGRIGDAALRLVRAPGDGARAELAETVFAAAIAEAIAGDEAEARRLAVELAARTPVPAAAAALRARARGAVDPAVRAGALAALAAVDDPEISELAVAALDEGPTAGMSVVVAAAAALDRVGAGDVARSTVAAWLAEAKQGDAAAREASLAVLAVLPADRLLPIVVEVARQEPRGRAAACAVYGRAAAHGAAPHAATAWSRLIEGVRDPDAAVRAACATAAGTAGAAGAPHRRAVNVVAARLADRDLAVRAAAVIALARLDATRAAGELRGLAAGSHPGVLAALAEAWGRLPRPPADRLIQLADHAAPDVRAAAVAALVRLGDPPALAAAARRATDAAEEVRIAAVGAIRDPGVLAELTRDPAPDVAAAADEALVALRGRAATLDERLAALAAAEPASPQRVRAAASWLLAR
jgi:hypothetical protein